MRKKILFIITQSELGGAQRWVFDVATSLDKKLYEIVVAGGETVKSRKLLDRLEARQVMTRSLRYLSRTINPLKDFLALLEIYQLIRKERPDILQLCSTKAGIIGSIAGTLARAPKIIYRIGGWSFDDPRPRWQNWLFLWLEKLTAPLKDKIIVNSQKGLSDALQYKICPRAKLTLIYNGIDLSDNFPIKQLLEKKSKSKFTIGCIANFYPTKGLKYLIEAAQMLNSQFQISGLKIIIVGDGPERPLLEGLIDKYRLENVIELAGQQEDPWTYFLRQGGMDLFMIPSVKEGLPYVLLEAMANGLPIVATTVGGIPEIIRDGKNGLLVPPQNSEKLAEAVKKIIDDSNLARGLAQAVLQDVQKFNLSTMINAIVNEYEVSLD